jgi:hypothetical protein
MITNGPVTSAMFSEFMVVHIRKQALHSSANMGISLPGRCCTSSVTVSARPHCSSASAEGQASERAGLSCGLSGTAQCDTACREPSVPSGYAILFRRGSMPKPVPCSTWARALPHTRPPRSSTRASAWPRTRTAPHRTPADRPNRDRLGSARPNRDSKCSLRPAAHATQAQQLTRPAPDLTRPAARAPSHAGQ